MDITDKQIQQLAHLAQLSLSPQEQIQLKSRLEQMVGYLQSLAQVEGEVGDGEHPTTCVVRSDQVQLSMERDKLLAQAPETRQGYVVTPMSVEGRDEE